MAARPPTLVASIIPTLIGSALAWRESYFHWISAIIALICALFIQIGTNFANDYYDCIRGADTSERKGSTRATSSQLISLSMMRKMFITIFSLAFIFGLYLIDRGGGVILFIGLASILLGWAYTGGPYPLAYHGMGELFTILCFGLVAVMGTFYVQSLFWSWESFWLGLGAGSMCTTMIVVNNIRDIDEDRKHKKNTLAVRMGFRASVIEYALLYLIAISCPIILFIYGSHSYWVFLPSIIILWAWHHVWKMFICKGFKLNNLLVQTAITYFIYGLLFGLAMLL